MVCVSERSVDMTYGITCSGTRSWTEYYDTREGLLTELEYMGLSKSLADFGAFDKYGMAQNKYQCYTVTAYEE